MHNNYVYLNETLLIIICLELSRIHLVVNLVGNSNLVLDLQFHFTAQGYFYKIVDPLFILYMDIQNPSLSSRVSGLDFSRSHKVITYIDIQLLCIYIISKLESSVLNTFHTYINCRLK